MVPDSGNRRAGAFSPCRLKTRKPSCLARSVGYGISALASHLHSSIAVLSLDDNYSTKISNLSTVLAGEWALRTSIEITSQNWPNKPPGGSLRHIPHLSSSRSGLPSYRVLFLFPVRGGIPRRLRPLPARLRFRLPLQPSCDIDISIIPCYSKRVSYTDHVRSKRYICLNVEASVFG